MPATLAEQLEPSFVSFEDLKSRYRPMLGLVKELIGVVPNCDLALEMWRPGFRTYNLLVPACLNLPASLFGRGAPKDLVGLGMYISSRAAECAYCSAHTCSYALRRGASEDAITGTYSEVEGAVVRLAEGMAKLPADLTPQDVAALLSWVEPHEAEDIALGVSLMGFLNKFMDAMGIELEANSIADVSSLISPTGWSGGQHLWNSARSDTVIDLRDGGPVVDDLRMYGRVLRQGPGAVRLERMWTKGVPSSGKRAVAYVKQTTGLNVPLLGDLRRGTMVRGLATVIRDNVDPTISAVGLRAKALAGWIYAHHAMNPELIDQATVLVNRYCPELDRHDLFELQDSPKLNAREQAAVDLAIAISPSPAEVAPELVERVSAELTAAEIVELVVWISVQQLLHRYRIFADARRASGMA